MANLFLDFNSEIETTRRNLPHWDQEGKLQFVTFHLADSLSQEQLQILAAQKEAWLRAHPQPWDKETEKAYYAKFLNKIDYWLDQGYGSCILKNKGLARIVEDSLDYYNEKKYLLNAYVIMSNHVHVLFEIYEGQKLPKILHGWKGYTAFSINKTLGKSGKLWHEESFDRLIRDENHFYNVIEYIKKNIQQGGVLWRIEEI